ncbi:MAG: tRNA lysidine(34) synthetase TilS [Actinomycetota bacterium]
MTAADHPPPVVEPEIDELLARCTFPARGSEVIAAVSGGADSLALLVLAVRAQLVVTAVHVDHGLRPDSAAEADVVADAARTLGAGFRSVRVNVDPGPDLEQRARLARRQALGPEAMTGHTADDQAETVLINLLRGAGVNGLSAMAPGHRHPILALRRAETVAVCTAAGLAPVRDPSNDDPRFVRNRVRHELLPLLADIADRDPVPLLARTADRAREVRTDLAALAASVDPTDTRAAADHPPSVHREALRAWLVDDRGHPPSAAELDRVLAVVRHEVVACELPGGRRVSRRDGTLRIDSS